MVQVLLTASHIFLHCILKNLHIHRILIPEDIADGPFLVINADFIAKTGLNLYNAQIGNIRLYLINTNTFLAQM